MVKRLFYRVMLAVMGLGLGVGLLEWGLRGWDRRVAGSDRMDPGIFRYEATLGWEMTPGWEGGHRHLDFEVRYRVNRLGFRADTAFADSRPGPVTAVLGDSFTFGLGVEDDETFVHRLDAALRTEGLGCAANFAVPGTSTDQQALLLERRLVHFRPAALILVVYLGNDLVDNMRPYPVQASNAKPYFDLGAEGLLLRNVPVPQEQRAVTNPQGDLRRAILGEANATAAPAGARWAIVQRLRTEQQDHREAIEAALDPSMRLFQAIVARMQGAATDAGATLTLALLPGRSYLDHPESLSTQYQDTARRHIAEWAQNHNLPVIDLATHMRGQSQGKRTGWYHPHEGHLTPAGHAIVAEQLLPALTESF